MEILLSDVPQTPEDDLPLIGDMSRVSHLLSIDSIQSARPSNILTRYASVSADYTRLLSKSTSVHNQPHSESHDQLNGESHDESHDQLNQICVLQRRK